MDIDEEAREFSLLDKTRWDIIKDGILATEDNGGEIWECGAFQGGTALKMRSFTGVNSKRVIRAFDTFEGLPTQSEMDTHPVGAIKADYAQARNRMETFNIKVYKGLMPETFQGLEECKISVAHIDVDQFESVKNCLEWIYPRMQSKGWMIIDDYNDKCCLGAKVATDDFIKAHGLQIIVGGEFNPQVYFIKP